MKTEEWRPVRGFEGNFEVSSYGNVRSVDRWVTYNYGTSVRKRFFEGKMLVGKLVEDGYIEVHLRNQKKNIYRRVHKLVADAFLEPIEGCNVIDHKDDDKTNNNVDNLKRCTTAYNTKKAFDVGSLNVRTTKITEDVKSEIRDLIKAGYSDRKIARETSVSSRSAGRIRRGEI